PHPALARVLEPGRRGVSFAALFGRSPPVTADAPGRVNLIGEHTDYNQGFVLPMPIPQRTVAELAPRRRAGARGEREPDRRGGAVRARRGDARPRLARLRAGAHVGAAGRRRADPRLRSPPRVQRADRGGPRLERRARGRGAARAARGLSPPARRRRAGAPRPAGRERVRRRAGRGDGPDGGEPRGRGRALLIDTRSLEHRSVALPAGAELVVIDSGVAHRNRAGGYNARRAECERACGLLGVRALRDLAAADLPQLAALPDPLARRVRHVVGENERVLAAVAALE